MPLFGRRKSKPATDKKEGASLEFHIRSVDEAEEILEALQGLKEAQAQEEFSKVDSAVQAFFGSPSWAACKRAVETLRHTLFGDTAKHILVIMAAQSRNEGDEEGERLFRAHLDLLMRCRRDGIDAAFARARKQDPDTYGWS